MEIKWTYSISESALALSDKGWSPLSSLV